VFLASPTQKELLSERGKVNVKHVETQLSPVIYAGYLTKKNKMPRNDLPYVIITKTLKVLEHDQCAILLREFKEIENKVLMEPKMKKQKIESCN